MKIVLYGNYCVSYTSETHHAHSLEALGHQVIRLQETTVPAEIVLRESLQADALVWIHSHGFIPPGVSMGHVLAELRKASIPTIAFHLDLYYGIPGRWAEYRDATYMKVVHWFSVDGPMVDALNAQANGTKAYYLPPGVLADECYLATPDDRYDVVFVGSERYHPEWPYRPQLIAWLRDTYGERFHQFGQDSGRVVRGAELNQVYANAKVVVGDSFCPGFDYGPYFSDRIMETCGRGGMIIHPRVKGIDECFVEGEEIVLYDYNDWDGLKGLIDHYVEHDEERELIRLAGHERVKAEHTYKIRWQTILETVFGA